MHGRNARLSAVSQCSARAPIWHSRASHGWGAQRTCAAWSRRERCRRVRAERPCATRRGTAVALKAALHERSSSQGRERNSTRIARSPRVDSLASPRVSQGVQECGSLMYNRTEELVEERHKWASWKKRRAAHRRSPTTTPARCGRSYAGRRACIASTLADKLGSTLTPLTR